MTRTFSEFLADRLGKARLTPRLRRDYEIAVPQKRFRELEIEWERETYGAPLETLRAAAPDILAALKNTRAMIRSGILVGDGRHDVTTQIDAAIAKAEGS